MPIWRIVVENLVDGAFFNSGSILGCPVIERIYCPTNPFKRQVCFDGFVALQNNIKLGKSFGCGD